MPVIGIDSVYFQMEDVDTGERVPCTASLETVQDRIAKAGGTPTGDPITDFDYVRVEIEEAASRQYDATGKKPFVTSRTLKP